MLQRCSMAGEAGGSSLFSMYRSAKPWVQCDCLKTAASVHVSPKTRSGRAVGTRRTLCDLHCMPRTESARRASRGAYECCLTTMCRPVHAARLPAAGYDAAGCFPLPLFDPADEPQHSQVLPGSVRACDVLLQPINLLSVFKEHRLDL